MSDQGDAKILEIVRRQAPNDSIVDLIFTKGSFVLPEVDASKPLANVHGRFLVMLDLPAKRCRQGSNSAHRPPVRACYRPLSSLMGNLLPETNNLSYQQLKIGAPRAMVVDRDSQAVSAMDSRVRDGGGAIFLEPHHDFGVEALDGLLVEARRAIAKANDVDGGPGYNFEQRL
ncbi:MAG: hypothetical protein WBV83_13065 [Bradyrhizobium sp.]|uniref:hypothetical protein n=1 Tax=Bradyrhizobium sp. TaxID=376 RepID=UPI003BC19974